MGCRRTDTYRNLYKKLKILPLQLQHILSLLLFAVNSKGQHIENLVIHSKNTRQNSNLHLLRSNLATYQKGFYYFGIKFLTSFPSHVKNLSHNTKQFQSALKCFIHTSSFHSMNTLV